MVKTSKAKIKSNVSLKNKTVKITLLKGHDAVIKYMTEIGFTPKEFLTKNKMAEVLDKFKFQTEDDLFAAVGYGEIVRK